MFLALRIFNMLISLEKTFKIYNQQSEPAESLGGKADGLLFMANNGINVPEFFVIPSNTIDLVLNQQYTSQQLIQGWIDEFDPNPSFLWSLRSSAEVEDGKEKSYAGIFTSVMNCQLEEMSEALDQVIEGFEKAKSSGYHEGDDFGYNVVIQRMIDADYSGVGFSINPMDYESENPLINIIPGMGTKLVSGEENALIFEIGKNNEPLILSQETDLRGERLINGNYEVVQQESDQIVIDLQMLFAELRSKLVLFEEMKGFPVDTEFAILEGEIYWLQIRPVTNHIPKGKYIVWDNSNSAVNYPGIVMPLTSSFVLHSYSSAYRTMIRFLGAGEKFMTRNEIYFSNMLTSIHGAVYYNITAWQTMLYQLPFGKKTSKLIAKTLGAEEAKFEKPKKRASPLLLFKLIGKLFYSVIFFNKLKRRYLAEYEKAKELYTHHRLSEFSYDELIAEFNSLERDLGKEWFPPMINGFFTMLSYNSLQKVVNKSRLAKNHPNFLNDALTGNGDVISVRIVRQLQNLLRNINLDTDAKDIILNTSDELILEELQKKCPDIASQIEFYLDEFGERCDEGELKIETVNYREDPSKFIEFLRLNLVYDSETKPVDEPVDYKKVIDDNYRYNFLKKWLLKNWVAFTIKRVKDRENFRFIRTKTFNLIRVLFRTMDDCLLEDGFISNKGDSLYLELHELMNSELRSEYKQIIETRKREYQNYSAEDLPSRYYEVGGKFYPAVENIYAHNGDELKGIGCSSGIRTGEVVFVTKENLHEVEVEGKILVATFFEPGWIGLFARCSGLISERGSLLSHTSILCRELNIPAIVGAKKILTKLENGEVVKMNGSNGLIEKMNHEQV